MLQTKTDRTYGASPRCAACGYKQETPMEFYLRYCGNSWEYSHK